MSDLHKGRLLLAEDDRDFRMLVARHLRRSGFEVIEAHNGVTALSRLADSVCRCGASHFDLLISDVRMPGHSGLDLVSELRRCDWAMPVVLITAFGTRETHEEAARLGAVLLDKPVDLDVLTATVAQQLA